MKFSVADFRAADDANVGPTTLIQGCRQRHVQYGFLSPFGDRVAGHPLGLSIAGTIAMFLVGGGILIHGVPALHHAVEAIPVPLLPDLIVGVVAGGLSLLLVTLAQKLWAIFKKK